MPSLIRNLTKDAVVLIAAIYTLEFVIHEENVINSFLSIHPPPEPSTAAPLVPHYCYRALQAASSSSEHHTQGRHGLSLVSPSNEAFILGEIPAG